MPDKITARHGLDCLDNCYIALLNKYDFDFSICFSESWSFKYNNNSSSILGDKIDKGDSNIIQIISDIWGIKISYADFSNDFEGLCQKIQKALGEQTYPIIHIDSYYCPWYPIYQKLHRSHFCIVTGIDNNGDFLCMDPILGRENSILPRKELFFCYSDMLIFDANDNNIYYIPDNPYSFLKKGLSRFIQEKCAEQIEIFGTDFNTSFSFEKEFEHFNEYFFDSSLFKQFTYIGGARELYSECLVSFFNRTKDPALKTYSEEIKQIASRWHTVKGMLVKSHYSGFDECIKKKISDQIRIISQAEDVLSRKLHAYCIEKCME